MKHIFLIILVSVLSSFLYSKENKTEIQKIVKKEAWAKYVVDELKQRTDKYVVTENWLESRLQMYWNTHATEIYITGEFFDHIGGDKAPAPTVMLSGARSHATNYVRPKLEDIVPYQEDSRGMWLTNKQTGEKEWASISKTGNIIQSINQEIMGYARDAAFLYWLNGNEVYAKAAAKALDTYLTGIYYRNVPFDLNYGHQQTLVGMASFEVIHEDIVASVAECFDFLKDYLSEKYSNKMQIYEEGLKKWAENIIANGVPHNNWNMMQARFVLNIANVLQPDSAYKDGRGRDYYIDYVINKSSIRQWSLKKLAEYGYDSETGIWAECAGYSNGVLGDYTEMVSFFDRELNHDLLQDIPVIATAVKNSAQYLAPDQLTLGFGDTHPSRNNPDCYKRMIRNAQRWNKTDDEEYFTRMLLTLFPEEASQEDKPIKVSVATLFADKPLKLNPKYKAGNISDYVSPVFYAKNNSWIVQRNGMDAHHSLQATLNGSMGNHQHANGISMELYAKGLRLAPDGGIGKTLYSGLDYLEYYSQFPAHNTVCVDGISSYPIMKSNHGFSDVTSEVGDDYSYTAVSFLEPESHSEQNRIVAIINTSDSTGFFVDIFRSRRLDGNDKFHDYFYHNMGQEMNLSCSNMQPTEELAFAGAHLYAYSYLYNKEAETTSKDVWAEFRVLPDAEHLKHALPGHNMWKETSMKLWMKGSERRTIFKAFSPTTEGLGRIPNMPYNINNQPTLTFVARQEGEAWFHPFVTVFEPTDSDTPSKIRSVSFPETSGEQVIINVTLTDGTICKIISDGASKIKIER